MTDLQLHQVLHRETTPLYVFDLAALPQRVATLREHLPEGVGLCYAVKANPFLLSALDGVVERFEICSPGELVLCQQAGLSSDQYVLSGVYKEPAAMGELVAQGEIGCYTVESMTQFSVLYGAALAARKPISLLLRLTSGNQFGMDQEEIRWILDHYGEDPCLDIRGIQYFSGTQKHSLKRLARELALVDQFLASLTPVHPLRELEFGPGFPVAYFPEDEMDEETFLTEFADLLRGLTFRGKITLELGRSIAAGCGTYLTRVVDVKENRGEKYAIVDGGMHQLVYYGQSMAMKHPPVRPLSPRVGEEPQPWTLCGALCTINDILVKRLPLGGLEIGDVLVFEQAGAYCMTEGIALFLSRDLPGVVLCTPDGRAVLARDHLATHPLNTPNHQKEWNLWKD